MFKFTIRELLLLTLVVAILVGWWAHYNSYRLLLFHANGLLKEAWDDHDVAERRAEYWQQKYESLKVEGELNAER